MCRLRRCPPVDLPAESLALSPEPSLTLGPQQVPAPFSTGPCHGPCWGDGRSSPFVYVGKCSGDPVGLAACSALSPVSPV